MKKRITAATIVLTAFLWVICSAVMNNYDGMQALSRRRPLIISKWTIRETYVELIAYFSELQAYKARLHVNRVDIDFSEVKEAVKERKRFFEEVLSTVSIEEPTEVTQEEFLVQMQKLDQSYGVNVFFENGTLFFERAQEKGKSVYLLPAIICEETKGSRFKGKNNLWNGLEFNPELNEDKSLEEQRDIPVLVFRNFETLEESIEAFFGLMNKPYYQSADTIKDFAEIWAPNTPESPTQAIDFAISIYNRIEVIKNL